MAAMKTKPLVINSLLPFSLVVLLVAAAPAHAHNTPKPFIVFNIATYFDLFVATRILSFFPDADTLPSLPPTSPVHFVFTEDITFPTGSEYLHIPNVALSLWSGKSNGERVSLIAEDSTVAGFFRQSGFFYPNFEAHRINFVGAGVAAIETEYTQDPPRPQLLYLKNCAFTNNKAAVHFKFVRATATFRDCDFVNNGNIFVYDDVALPPIFPGAPTTEPSAVITTTCCTFSGTETLYSWKTTRPTADGTVTVCPPTKSIKFGENVTGKRHCACK